MKFLKTLCLAALTTTAIVAIAQSAEAHHYGGCHRYCGGGGDNNRTGVGYTAPLDIEQSAGSSSSSSTTAATSPAMYDFRKLYNTVPAEGQSEYIRKSDGQEYRVIYASKGSFVKTVLFKLLDRPQSETLTIIKICTPSAGVNDGNVADVLLCFNTFTHAAMLEVL